MSNNGTGGPARDEQFQTLVVRETLAVNRRLTAREIDVGNLFVSSVSSFLHADIAGNMTVSGDIISAGNIQSQSVTTNDLIVTDGVTVDTGLSSFSGGLTTGSFPVTASSLPPLTLTAAQSGQLITVGSYTAAATGPIVLLLPTATTPGINFKFAQIGAVTGGWSITASGTETIRGAKITNAAPPVISTTTGTSLTFTDVVNFSGVEIMSDGTHWRIVDLARAN